MTEQVGYFVTILDRDGRVVDIVRGTQEDAHTYPDWAERQVEDLDRYHPEGAPYTVALGITREGEDHVLSLRRG